MPMDPARSVARGMWQLDAQRCLAGRCRRGRVRRAGLVLCARDAPCAGRCIRCVTAGARPWIYPGVFFPAGGHSRRLKRPGNFPSPQADAAPKVQAHVAIGPVTNGGGDSPTHLDVHPAALASRRAAPARDDEQVGPDGPVLRGLAGRAPVRAAVEPFAIELGRVSGAAYPLEICLHCSSLHDAAWCDPSRHRCLGGLK